MTWGLTTAAAAILCIQVAPAQCFLLTPSLQYFSRLSSVVLIPFHRLSFPRLLEAIMP